jgi:hypothetical protein
MGRKTAVSSGTSSSICRQGVVGSSPTSSTGSSRRRSGGIFRRDCRRISDATLPIGEPTDFRESPMPRRGGGEDSICLEHRSPCVADADDLLHKPCHGRWRASVSLGFGPDGKRIRRTVTGQTNTVAPGSGRTKDERKVAGDRVPAGRQPPPAALALGGARRAQLPRERTPHPPVTSGPAATHR